MNEQELAVDRRLRDAIIHKSDKNQEMRILVIYPKNYYVSPVDSFGI